MSNEPPGDLPNGPTNGPTNERVKPANKPLVAVPSRSNQRSTAGVAPGSPASKAQTGRLLRTVLLGTLALGAGVLYLADMFGVDKAELLGYMGVSALLLLGLILLAALAVGLLRLLRR